MAKINVADQLRLHERKRQALEQLKQFAVQLASAGDGMEALQFLARPSQTKGGKSFSFLSCVIGLSTINRGMI